MTGAIKTKHILVVEDDEMFRILLRDMFWIHSTDHSMIEVITRRSLAEARSYIESTQMPLDVIFVGLWLLTPRIGGIMVRDMSPTLEFIKELKSSERYKNSTVVVYSRFGEKEFKEKAKEVGADHYLVKGELSPKEVVDFVETL